MFRKILSYHANHSKRLTNEQIVLELNHLYQFVPYILLPFRCILIRYLEGLLNNTRMTIYGCIENCATTKSNKMYYHRMEVGYREPIGTKWLSSSTFCS